MPIQQNPVITLPPYEAMSPGAKKMRDFYALRPGAPIYQREFGFFTWDRWKKEGHIKDGEDLDALFGYDPPGKYFIGNLGWCEAGFCPNFEEKVLEDQGDYELVPVTISLDFFPAL